MVTRKGRASESDSPVKKGGKRHCVVTTVDIHSVAGEREREREFTKVVHCQLGDGVFVMARCPVAVVTNQVTKHLFSSVKLSGQLIGRLVIKKETRIRHGMARSSPA